MREYANMTSMKDTFDILEFYRNGNNQLREQVKDLHEILSGIVMVLQNLHQNKQNQSTMTPPNLSVKANHLMYIVPRWYDSRIYTDCQQNFFSSEHDTGGKILLVTFLEEQKKEYDTQR